MPAFARGSDPRRKAGGILKDVYNESANRLKRLDRPTRQELLNEIEESLAAFGRSLYAALGCWRGPQDAADQMNLYFWPGYESVLKEGRNKRVTLTIPLGGTNVPCGVGFFDNSGKEYRIAPTSLWFHTVLSPYQIPSSGREIVPGSTHSWNDFATRTRNLI